MTDKSKLFGIGDIARLFHVSVSTLRHYENEGLLMPEYTDPRTGYRYYSPRQFEVLNTIRYLRVLDMPLAEIADFLGKRDVDRIEEKLRQQKNALAAKQRELARIERKIDNRLRGIADAKTAPIGVITRSTVPAARIVWMSVADSLRISDALDMETPIQDLARNTDEAMVFLGKVGVGISAEHLISGQFAQYDGVFLVLDDEDQYSGEVMRLPEDGMRGDPIPRQSSAGAGAIRKAAFLHPGKRLIRHGIFPRDHPHRLRLHGRYGKIRHGDPYSGRRAEIIPL